MIVGIEIAKGSAAAGIAATTGTAGTLAPAAAAMSAAGVAAGTAITVSGVADLAEAWKDNVVFSKAAGRQPSKTDSPSKQQIEKYQTQLRTDGMNSLEKSRSSLSGRLADHIGKLNAIKANGGHTSSVEREIRTFSQEINAIDIVLGSAK